MIKPLFWVALIILPLACGGSAPSNATDFCQQRQAIFCDKVFQCVPTDAQDQVFKDTFGSSVTECKTSKASAACATATSSCPRYDSSAAQLCLTDLAGLTCGDFSNPPPADCDAACP